MRSSLTVTDLISSVLSGGQAGGRIELERQYRVKIQRHDAVARAKTGQKWAHLDSNQGPTGYEPAALSTELWALWGSNYDYSAASFRQPLRGAALRAGGGNRTRNSSLEGCGNTFLQRPRARSGRPDLNRRPLRPKRSALAVCATPRRHDKYTAYGHSRQAMRRTETAGRLSPVGWRVRSQRGESYGRSDLQQGYGAQERRCIVQLGRLGPREMTLRGSSPPGCIR